MDWDKVADLAQDRMLWSAVLALVVFLLLPIWITMPEKAPLKKLKSRLGLNDLNTGLFFLAAILWLGLFSVLFFGLFWVVIEVLTHPVVALLEADGARDTGRIWDWRFKLVQVTALTAVLGAVVSLPVTLNRLRLQREANRTAEESLFNQKITEAAADLHARRQRTMRGIDRSVDVWEDDIVRRNAAINRLEGLVEERMRAPVEDASKRDVLSRVSRLLSIYVRDLSKEVRPVHEPAQDRSPREFLEWARDLEPRSDMENAARTLGRLRGHARDLAEAVTIDLEMANLQGCRLVGLDFDGGIFRRAQLQGADLRLARMERAFLDRARLHGALLSKARLQEAKLGGAKLQSADLTGALMQKAALGGAQMQEAILSWAQMQGAALYATQMQKALLSDAQMQGAILTGAQMQEANLGSAQMQGANLSEAKMQGANLREAQMQGANLSKAQMSEVTVLTAANLRGAAVRSLDSTTLAQLEPFWGNIFADGTIDVSGRTRPAHWVEERLDFPAFKGRWRAWQRSIGMDPENPE